MQPKIIFLGTGGGRFNLRELRRSPAGIIIQLGSDQICIDPGPNSSLMAKLCKVDLAKTSVIFVSHEHIDNCNDLNLIIELTTASSQKPILICNKAVSENTILNYSRKLLSNTIVLEPCKEINLNNMRIIATPTKNHDNAIGCVISAPDLNIGYIPETAHFASLAKPFWKCDVLVISLSCPKDKTTKTHLSSLDVIKVLQRAKPKLAVVTHLTPWVIDANPVYEARFIQKQSGIQTIAATDGMILDPISYSAKATQKKLVQF